MCLCLVLVCCVLFLFFKQKTAYEMRISDWSSDVCSSDLRVDGGEVTELPGHRTCPQYCTGHQGLTFSRRVSDSAMTMSSRSGVTIAAPVSGPPDRKRVVSGKSVSVRVDLGGRRIIKKKKQRRNRTDKHKEVHEKRS